MGCDIHAFVEVRYFKSGDKKREHGIWISRDKWMVNEDYVLDPENTGNRYAIDYGDEIYSRRSYLIFAILAGVRNYYDIKPVSLPKGLPSDVSPEVKAQSDWWGEDGHSHSFLTLKEILDYDWTQTVELEDWCKNEEEAKKLYGENLISLKPNNIGLLTAAYKTQLYKYKNNGDFNEALDKLTSFVDIRHNKEHPEWDITADDIRLIFWFDN